MSFLLQLVINSLIAGSIYSLITSGFSLINTVNKFINLAHGVVIGVSGYLFFMFFSNFNLNFLLSMILALLLTSFLGVLINTTVFRILRKKKSSSVIMLISSIALLTLFNSLILFIAGSDTKIINISEKNIVFDFLGARITLIQVIILLTTIVFFIFLWLLLKKTRIGKAMRAVSDNVEVSQTIGINPEKIYNYTFFIGSFLGSVGGILTGLEINLSPYMSIALIVKAFASSVIGGLNSIPGAILGSLFLGFAENFGGWYLPSEYKEAISFFLLFIFLLIKPSGILGIKKREEVAG